MTRLMHRSLTSTPRLAVASNGIELTDAQGRTYIDASGGAAVSCLGHGHPDVIAAVREQLDKLAYAHTGFFTSEAAEELAETLVEGAPEDLDYVYLDYVYLVSGGSEAVEAALKMARQYFVEIGEPQRRHIIARRQSYHGNTLGALATGGNQWRRAQFEPLLVETHHVDPCYAYRDQRESETDEDYATRLAQQLEDKILALGSDQVIAFVAETVVGATMGAVPPQADYLKKVRAVCDRHGVLLILDEVMCGMGRCGTMHACERYGVSPDLMTLAKGLGGGYQPIGAVLVAGRIYDAMANGSGFFQHGHTYMGHPMAAAAGLAVQKVFKRDNLIERVDTMGTVLHRLLRDRLGQHSHVGDIRGVGLFQGIELVADRETKEPFDPSRKIHAAIKSSAMDRGLMVYPMGGTIDGRRGDHILLAPPFIVEHHHIETIVGRLADSIEAVIGR